MTDDLQVGEIRGIIRRTTPHENTSPNHRFHRGGNQVTEDCKRVWWYIAMVS